ncbi:zinc metalloprotease [uncultured Fibrella sp.]|uniref:zinc metalloprotease n=1 Tax=uncultured Fibrella sp. TaxID=1284596 RepID=UPI0035CB0D32
MKKVTLPILCLALIGAVSSCFDPNIDQSSLSAGSDRNAKQGDSPRSCASMDVLAENIKENPGLAKKMEEIDEHAAKFAAQRNGRAAAGTAVPYSGVITIPVRVHVLYNTAAENISLYQIKSQITVLNQDYSNTNADRTMLPGVFSGLASNMQIQFTLADTDVDRKQSNKTSWGTRDAMKSSKKGGVDAYDPANYLNIWICNIGGGILGYAQFPGGTLATDGVVIGPQYFGSSSVFAGGYYSAPYDKGRTATHEIGHWLNLRHIWGDANCGSDLVADTPTQQTSNFGCPSFPHVTCGNGPNGDLFMNYMDYTDDPCMYMFTNGQTTRSRALFASDGVRRTFVQ